MKQRTAIPFFFLLLLFATGVLLSITIGGPENLFATGISDVYDFIFWEVRLPKTVTAILAGGALSIAGLILQIIFRNPLAGPYVLGISSGASLMVALLLLGSSSLGLYTNYFFGKSMVMLAAMAGSFVVTLLILSLSEKISSNVILLLIGLMLSQVCGALEGVLEYFADPGSLKSFVMWNLGSLSATTLPDLRLFVPVVIICLGAVFLFIKPLNAFLLGQNYSTNAGINYTTNRFYLILISSALTGVITAYCGPVAFVGIAVPLLSRMLFHTSSQVIHICACMLIGATILLFADVLCHAFSGTAMPVNMVTTFVGAPLVIYLLFKNKQW